MRKTIYCLIGPSGSGKTFIGSALKKLGYKEIVSHTTRNKRIGEIDNVDYHFVSKEEFKEIKIIEKNFYSGEWYGTSYEEVESSFASHDTLYQVTTFSGFEALKHTFPNVRVISVYIFASQETREKRMSIRGDSLSNIQKRITVDKDYWDSTKEKCDYVINNDGDVSVEKISQQLKNI